MLCNFNEFTALAAISKHFFMFQENIVKFCLVRRKNMLNVFYLKIWNQKYF